MFGEMQGSDERKTRRKHGPHTCLTELIKAWLRAASGGNLRGGESIPGLCKVCKGMVLGYVPGTLSNYHRLPVTYGTYGDKPQHCTAFVQAVRQRICSIVQPAARRAQKLHSLKLTWNLKREPCITVS